jgi:hypothetical protein
MTYEDLLKKYQYFDRTRLFGPEWTITQQWTNVNVPWSADYHDTKFEITLTKKSPVIIVLSQVRLNISSSLILSLMTISSINDIFMGLKGNMTSSCNSDWNRRVGNLAIISSEAMETMPWTAASAPILNSRPEHTLCL